MQCQVIGLPRSSWYYTPATETEENLELMRSIDRQYLATPFYGSRKLAKMLGVNRKRVQRLMRVMGLEAASGCSIQPFISRRNLEDQPMRR